MSALDPSRWPALSARLGELLDLAPPARAARLAEWRLGDAEFAQDLAQLLQQESMNARDGFLEGSALPDLPARDEALAGVTLGAYTLERPLGVGGMGAVWLARRSDGRYEGRVAIKFPSLALLARGGAARFRREGQLLARLDHPHIARLIDAGVTERQQPYLVLEYVEGAAIDQWCDSRRLDLGARVRLLQDVIGAVAHAHGQLILHRDLKPSNILVDGAGQVKLLDFGIAKLLDDDATAGSSPPTALTQAAGRAFTPDYAAPEQWRGQASSTRTDVHALGVLLFELLAGSRPPLGASEDRTLPRPSEVAQRLTAALAMRRAGTPTRLARALRGDLDNIIAKCLQAEPAARYPSVEALGADLQRWLQHEPVSARPDALGYRAAKFLRRHRAGATAGTLLTLAIVGGVTGTWLQAEHARTARDHALRAKALSEANTDFLTFMLESAPGDGAFTLVELIDRAEQLAAKQYADDPAIQATLRLQLGGRFAQLRLDARALANYREAVRLAATQPDGGLQARAECGLGEALANAGEVDQGRRKVDAAIERLRTMPGGQRDDAFFACYAARAEIAKSQRDAPAIVAAARAALAHMPRPGPGQQADAVNVRHTLGSGLIATGQLELGLRTMREALEANQALGRDRTARGASLWNESGKAFSDAGAQLEASRAYRRAFEILEAVDPAQALDPAIIGNHAKALAATGHFDEALPLFERAIAAAERVGEDLARGATYGNAASVECDAGHLERCEAHLLRARPALEHAVGPAHTGVAFLDVVAGRLALERGQAETAARHFDHALVIYAGAKSVNLRKVLALAGLARAHERLGLHEQARADADAAVAAASKLSSGLGYSEWLGQALLARAEVERAQGRAADARVSAGQALAQLRLAVGDAGPVVARAQALLGAL